MTTFSLIGDHTEYNCGSAAVIEVLRHALATHGTLVADPDTADLVIVNGEGTMHHGASGFHTKMRALVRAQKRGQRTALVNTVWHENPRDYDDTLKALHDCVTRGRASLAELTSRHSVAATGQLDQSYFAEVSGGRVVAGFEDQVLLTDMWADNLGAFVWLEHPRVADARRLDITKFTWPDLVATLRTARLVITGRHHVLYAACRAEVPFVAIRGNSHKMEDLCSDFHIPVASSVADIAALVQWSRANDATFRRLFDQMRAKRPWSPELALSNRARPLKVYPPHSAALRARLAVRRGAFFEALAPFEAAQMEAPADANLKIEWIEAALRAGQLTDALPSVFRWLFAGIDVARSLGAVAGIGRSDLYWTPRGSHSIDTIGWWAHAVVFNQALVALDFDRALVSADMARAEAKRSFGESGQVAAVVALALRATYLQEGRFATDVLQRGTDGLLDDWHRAVARVFVDYIRQFVSEDSAENIRQVMACPAWDCSDMRHVTRTLQWILDGETRSLLNECLADTATFPGNNGLLGLATCLAAQLGDQDTLERLAAGNDGARKEAAHNPFVAEAYVKINMPSVVTATVTSLGQQMALLQGHLRAFNALARDPSIRIAVVGNSPIEVGQGRGAEIDGHDVVLRMNRFETSDGFRADYGCKTDVVFTLEGGPLRELLAKCSRDCLIILKNPFGLRARLSQEVRAALGDGFKIGIVSDRDTRALLRKLGSRPSTGLLVTHMLHHARGTLNRQSFYGFSFVDQLETQVSSHYFEQSRANMSHSWIAERALFESYFRS